MYVVVAFLFITVTLIIWNHLKLMRRSRWSQQFQGPSPTFPIIGNSLEFVGHPSRFGQIFHENFKRYGSTWKVWLMDEPTLVTSDPDLLKTLLGSQNHLEKHATYKHGFEILLGKYGLITSSPKQWQVDRKLFNQVYNYEYLELSFKQCVNDWSKLQAELEVNVGNPVDVLPLMRNFFLEVILKSWNVDPNLITDQWISDIGESMERGKKLSKLRIMKPWTRNETYWNLFGYNHQLQKFHDPIRVYIAAVVDYFRQQHPSNTTNSKIQDRKTTRVICDLFGDMTRPFQWKYDHGVTLVGAGTDTSAIAATMTLFFLALNPECQKKVQNELDQVFDERQSEELVYSDMSKMKYLRACIKEAMRLHAPGPINGRTTSEDIVMADGRKIPKGTGVLIIHPELNMNPRTFPNPNKFDPERFNDSNSSSIKPYTFMPFSAGPRSCIGQKYAECIVSRLLAQILRQFSVKTEQKAEDISILYEIAGTPFPNVELVFTQRAEVSIK